MAEAVDHPIRRKIDRISKLSALPQVTWRLMGALREETTTPSDLQEIIESDAALTAKILSVANSAYYGLRYKVDTIKRAVVIIGLQELELMALSAGLVNVFDLSTSHERFSGEELWIHSMAVSWISRALAEEAELPEAGGIMIGGLLHDLGILTVASHLKGELAKMISLLESGMAWSEAEQKLNLYHTEIGLWLAQAWGLPDVHQAVIACHHQPERGGRYRLEAGVVCLADMIAGKMKAGLVLETGECDAGDVLAVTGLTEDQLKDVIRRAVKAMPKLKESWRNLLGSQVERHG